MSFLFLSLALFLVLFSARAGRKKFIKIFFPNEVSITAELAVTDEERQLGLMFREKIHSDQGMLLVFNKEDIYFIWMKNMRFPLDLLWLDQKKQIVHIELNVPPCKKSPCPSYYSKVPALCVLELKAGCVEKNQLKVNDRLGFILPPELQNQ